MCVVYFLFLEAGGEFVFCVWLAQPRLTHVRKCALSGSVLCQEGVLSGRNFVRQEYCQEGILSGRGFVRQEFCQEGILSGRNFVRKGFCQEGILSGRDFVRKRALPGSGLCQEGECFGVVCVVYFLFLGAGGESASGGAKGEWGRVSFFRLACPTSFDRGNGG